MANSNSSMIHKLQVAINNLGYKILLDKYQFYSNDQNRPVTVYKVMQAVPGQNGKSRKEKLFESASQIQIVLYLRDFWYYINDWEVPQDNETWNGIKAKRNISFQKKDTTS